MKAMEAQILISNLIERIVEDDRSRFTLPGMLTAKELAALQLAITALDGSPENLVISEAAPAVTRVVVPGEKDRLEESLGDENKEFSDEIASHPSVKYDVLEYPVEETNVRVCLDFGTAMSKATLVVDETNSESERIEVLELGIPGDQPEVSDHMLVSSVYLSNDGKLWFGQYAVAQSQSECLDGRRQRLDNIKRWLSEDGIHEEVNELFNPTDIDVTYGDMVLAYLMFLTWAMNDRVEELGFQCNISRRFAMPCFTGEKQRETEHLLGIMLGQSQLLADTFKEKMMSGIPLTEFVGAIKEIREKSMTYPFVANQLSEPLGVAGSIMSWTNNVNSLLLVVDVGAGTSDFSLFRIRFDPSTGESASREIGGSTRAITEAGNHLDKLLTEYILHKGEVTHDNQLYLNIRGALGLQIRHYKEALFRDQSLSVTLFGGETSVDVELEEFLQLESVKFFGNALRSCMMDILETIDSGWLRNAPFGGIGVALTGGGAELPMVEGLAEGSLAAQGIELNVKRTAHFPTWLEEEHHHLKDDYSRIAVSLGGARRQYITSLGASSSTGEPYATVTLDGYYTKGH